MFYSDYITYKYKCTHPNIYMYIYIHLTHTEAHYFTYYNFHAQTDGGMGVIVWGYEPGHGFYLSGSH